jgi:hypothetical protein
MAFVARKCTVYIEDEKGIKQYRLVISRAPNNNTWAHIEEIGTYAKRCHTNNAKHAEDGLLVYARHLVRAVNCPRYLGPSQ